MHWRGASGGTLHNQKAHFIEEARVRLQETRGRLAAVETKLRRLRNLGCTSKVCPQLFTVAKILTGTGAQ